MLFLFVLNDHPYGSERNYNALRLATSLAVDDRNAVRIFLLGDAVFSAVAGQTVPEGRHDIEWMLRRFAGGGRPVAACKTCMEARGVVPEALIECARQGTLDELTRWSEEAERVLVF